MEENKFKIIKQRCSICGKTIKKIATTDEDELEIKRRNFITYIDKYGQENNICRECESRYKITDNYSARGYGYDGSTMPNITKADKRSTPTYGIEIEVAGNISNIDKIFKLAYNEMTIGYDTSVEGAQFELSYCPGTYYWYNYESKLPAVCALLNKDKWVNKNSDTTGMHIHVGNINKANFMKSIIIELVTNEWFWSIITIFGERRLNQYCRPYILNGHHDAISWSTKWNTIEFRIFKTTFDFNKIMQRIKFIRQMIDNATENGINWCNFKNESKEYFLNLLKSYKGTTKDIKNEITKLFEQKTEEKEYTATQKTEIANMLRRLGTYDERFREENEEEDEETNELARRFTWLHADIEQN